MDSTPFGYSGALEQGSSWEEFCKNIWDGTSMDSEDSFMSRRAEFTAGAHGCINTMDFHSMVIITKAYHWVSPQVEGSDVAHLFDGGAVFLALSTASSCANLRIFDATYKVVSAAMEMLDAGLNPPPNSELRLHALSVIADCKWQQPRSMRNKLWSPEWMWEEYQRIYQRVTGLLKQNPSLDKQGTAIDHLENTGYALLQVAALYQPEELPNLVQQYNQRWGGNLSAVDGNFLTIKNGSEKNHRYWDFEIAKRFIAQNLNLEELDYCHERLVQAVNSGVKGEKCNLLKGLELQYRYLAKSFTNLLEFPIGEVE